MMKEIRQVDMGQNELENRKKLYWNSLLQIANYLLNIDERSQAVSFGER